MPISPVHAVTERTFPTRVLQADRPVLVQFWAPWCTPCRMVTPIVEELAADHAGVLDVVKVNVDDEPTLAIDHEIRSIPAFTIYTQGIRRHSWTGAAPKDALERAVTPYLRPAQRKEPNT